MRTLTNVFKEIQDKKSMPITNKDIEAIRNALKHYKDENPFTDAYKAYLNELADKVNMLWTEQNKEE